MTKEQIENMTASFFEELTEIEKRAVVGGAIGRYALGAVRGVGRALQGGPKPLAERVMGSTGKGGFLEGIKRTYERGAAAASSKALKAGTAAEGPTRQLKGLGLKKILGGAKAVAHSTPGRIATVGAAGLGTGALAYKALSGPRHPRGRGY